MSHLSTDLLVSLNDLCCLGLQGHQAGGGVGQHVEVRGRRGAHGGGPAL